MHCEVTAESQSQTSVVEQRIANHVPVTTYSSELVVAR
jgi:hypothetical protein